MARKTRLPFEEHTTQHSAHRQVESDLLAEMAGIFMRLEKLSGPWPVPVLQHCGTWAALMHLEIPEAEA